MSISMMLANMSYENYTLRSKRYVTDIFISSERLSGICNVYRETLMGVYSHLQQIVSDEDWVYEALGRIDELIDLTKDVAAFLDDNVAGTSDINSKRRSRCSFADIPVHHRNAIEQVIF